MSKAVLISIHPKWCEKIANGEKIISIEKTIDIKTIEVRKTRPKIRTPFPCYIYCTKGATTSDNLWITDLSGYNHLGNCKVIGEFVCDKIIKVNCDGVDLFDDETKQYIGKECCLNVAEYHKYTLFKSFGWHISNLIIYDKPKELSEFRTICKYGDYYPCHICNKAKRDSRHILYCDNTLKRPPQSWCYVEKI